MPEQPPGPGTGKRLFEGDFELRRQKPQLHALRLMRAESALAGKLLNSFPAFCPFQIRIHPVFTLPAAG